MMNLYLKFLRCFFAFALFISAGLLVAEDGRPEKPNVVLILTDDLGWQDVKCYDIDEPSPYETPNIDALAEKGVLFWQAYSPAPTCAPSRCAIMSGNHPARAQKTHVVGGAPPVPRNRNVRMMDPWYSGRIPEDEFTLAKALKAHGYTTGHSGKWHMAIDHNAYPQPADMGFDFTRSNRGSRSGMADRLKGFATDAADDPYRLDENGFPYHETNEDALTFLKENKEKPFFLYYATWLVHSPIHTRSEERLRKYTERMGIDPAHTPKVEVPGQQNPFFAAMVEELDYYLGAVFDYLDNTDDPRWPGHRLSENTYLIFTSDNGGMEGGPKERYTDNNPLDRGKISAKEGGTRVPLIITGPQIPAGVETDVVANGLDFYPTILSMVGAEKPEGKNLDGSDLLPLLHGDITDPTLVKNPDGSPRETMVWHFPHGTALESTIRTGDYKLIRNYDHLINPGTPELELFRLYESKDGEQIRVDIEEAENLADEMPERTREMNNHLTAILDEMEASYPYYNPAAPAPLPNKDKVPAVTSGTRDGQAVTFTYEENGAKVAHADLIYTLNGGERYEEWFRMPAKLTGEGRVTAELPKGTTHYYLNLIDENQFLRSYPEVVKKGNFYSESALAVAAGAKNESPKKPVKGDRNVPFNRWDTNKDDILTLEEYLTGQTGENLEQRYQHFDKNGDGKVTREEYVVLSAK
ncbi:sulfatase-like hydrolase/transferase [Verrucomicrobiales bacterium BCK34]|nr:sulfatase-like hydrolase/transferase [Verrucomicrobiales bacterium BCK34]